jgi:hypothetical protein
VVRFTASVTSLLTSLRRIRVSAVLLVVVVTAVAVTVRETITVKKVRIYYVTAKKSKI